MSAISRLLQCHTSQTRQWTSSTERDFFLSKLFQDTIEESERLRVDTYDLFKQVSQASYNLENLIFYDIPGGIPLPLFGKVRLSQDPLYSLFRKACHSLTEAAAKTFDGKLIELFNYYWENEKSIIHITLSEELKEIEAHLQPLYEELSQLSSQKSDEENILANSIVAKKKEIEQQRKIYQKLQETKKKKLHEKMLIRIFLEKVSVLALQKIRENPHSQGFIYRVKNNHAIYCYFIGSLHCTTHLMGESALVKEASSKSTKFYFETTNPLVWASSFLVSFIPNYIFSFNSSIDYAVYVQARSKNASICPLESVSHQFSSFFWSLFEKKQTPVWKDQESVLSRHNLSYSTNLQVLQAKHAHSSLPIKVLLTIKDWVENVYSGFKHDFYFIEQEWQEGQMRKKMFSKNQLDLRNKEWEKTIFPEIQDAKESICFTVGNSHLSGGNAPLLERLMSEFKVEKGKYDHTSQEISWDQLEEI